MIPYKTHSPSLWDIVKVHIAYALHFTSCTINQATERRESGHVIRTSQIQSQNIVAGLALIPG